MKLILERASQLFKALTHKDLDQEDLHLKNLFNHLVIYKRKIYGQLLNIPITESHSKYSRLLDVKEN